MAFVSNGNGAAEGNGTANGDASLEPIDKRKVFVGGLGPETAEDDLKTYFGQFGNVAHAVVKRDPTTGRSRCFAFVTFESSAGVKAVSAVSAHHIKGKKVDPKPAEPRPGEEPCVKIFVGGLDSSMSEEELKEYFTKFGVVKNVEWPKDRARDNAKKNFAFVEFESDSVVAEIIKNPKLTIGSRQCDVKKAIPAQKKQPGQFGQFDYGSPYGGYGYGAYGATGGYGDASYGAAGGYGYTGYEQSSYGGYDYGAAAAGGYGGYGAEASTGGYAPRGGARGAPRGRGAPMGAPGGVAGAGARGAARGYHPYRRQ